MGVGVGELGGGGGGGGGVTGTGQGSQDSSVVERRTRNRKVAGWSFVRSGWRIVFSGVSFLC